MSLTFKHKHAQEEAIVYVTGHLDSSAKEEFWQYVRKYGDGKKRLFIDLENVSGIDSAGLGILAAIVKDSQRSESSQRVTIVNPRGQVRKSMLLTNFPALTPVVDSDQEYSTFNEIKD